MCDTRASAVVPNVSHWLEEIPCSQEDAVSTVTEVGGGSISNSFLSPSVNIPPPSVPPKPPKKRYLPRSNPPPVVKQVRKRCKLN